MSKSIDVAARPASKPQAEAGRFDQTSVALHWLTAVLVAVQLTMGTLLSRGGDEMPALLTAHRSMGIVILIVAAARLVWRHRFAQLPPFPTSMPKLQQRLAKLNEYALYALLLIRPLSGLGGTLFHGRPFALFAWQVPALVARDAVLFHAVRLIHNSLEHNLDIKTGMLEDMRALPEPYASGEIEDLQRLVTEYNKLVDDTKRLNVELDNYVKKFKVQ